MDADSTSSRITYDEKFRSFENGEYDIMIGTQMIAKGLDFPDVSLVGVISLDNSLFAGSYRSFERTFSLLTQVVGRGGRGSERGLAFIQTYLPEHYVIPGDSPEARAHIPAVLRSHVGDIQLPFGV